MNHEFTKPYFCKWTQTVRLHVQNNKLQILNISLDVLDFLRMTPRHNSKPLFSCRDANITNQFFSHSLAKDLWTYFCDAHGEKSKPPTFSLTTKQFCAFDLSCRACGACGAGAGCWAWIPGGASAPLRFSPPTSDKLPSIDFPV